MPPGNRPLIARICVLNLLPDALYLFSAEVCHNLTLHKYALKLRCMSDQDIPDRYYHDHKYAVHYSTSIPKPLIRVKNPSRVPLYDGFSSRALCDEDNPREFIICADVAVV